MPLIIVFLYMSIFEILKDTENVEKKKMPLFVIPLPGENHWSYFFLHNW